MRREGILLEIISCRIEERLKDWRKGNKLQLAEKFIDTVGKSGTSNLAIIDLLFF
ncbi:hypothetical protein [Autumnicola psychrophila]|uniref:Uncharacterized protein n=1 Tax=Autumnicola psychrophila TaxID=3075592 RepID=A0ABU3DVT8_9FLAO|nr:hypothetical protein [Zunongwangia sp. F225]MDT0687748.1 hypothetical protein [Zunongwangia sp. F225]